MIPRETYEYFTSPEGVAAYYEIMPRVSEHQREIISGNLRRVHDAGIPVVAGTDTSVPGVLLGAASQMELFLLVQDGLQPEEALGAATINAAKMLGRDSEQGTIEIDKLADLVVLDANPLADIGNIRRISYVIKGGVAYDSEELLRRLR